MRERANETVEKNTAEDIENQCYQYKNRLIKRPNPKTECRGATTIPPINHIETSLRIS